MIKDFKKISDLISKSGKILILLHQYPDGDTIASSLALREFLVQKDKSVLLAVKGDIPEVFQFLPGVDEIVGDFLLGDFDLIFAIDCGDAKRTGFPDRLSSVCKIKPLINIDHHCKNDLHKIARINLIDERSAAAAEIVWDMLNFLKAKITPRIATYILSAIYFDTGGFQHSNLTEKTLQVASSCLSHGGRIALVSSSINNAKSTCALRLWGVALSRIKIGRNKIAISYLTNSDIENSGAKAEDASGIVNLMNNIPSAKVAILFVEGDDGTIKASLRTESSSVDVAKLARLFGGGGHKKASGFSLDGEMADLFKRRFANKK
ncbi:MAG: Bifunctional oligoribonuclease and PAP phosphatase NrnA [candidate division WS2 bacterium ADurb.Bin280]|uniref:Bifunctional oligoribonuclease and PAP phosphatase NrnA n=1 Tax=candidate division WS2 bacterium ADurb.Bin280 TaxID=1852829 RepID=A0A1V5SC72_9BACT|nr:MAG: Bifunctional oligoribonuclease and PAP phosphatase NrnA [candidate division WS2 bacterium ADurb.Bin280]